MSKIVRVSNSDYKISVQTGGTITLDTGARVGTTIITGSLDVMGTLTYLDTQNTQITDAIIVLNKGETNAYVTQQYSGLEISRGTNATYGSAFIVYDEKTNINGDGTIVFRYGPASSGSNNTSPNGAYIPLETDTIISPNNISLQPSFSTGLIKVTGVSDYYNTVVTQNDIDSIPNKKYVDQYVAQQIASAQIASIINGDSRVQVKDNSVYGLASVVEFTIDNALKAVLNSSSGFTIDGYLSLNSDVNSVYINNSNATLNLKLVSANGRVEVANYLQLDNQASTPSATGSGSLIYAKSSEGPGRTGLYFVNNTPNADELVSRNRALLWAMLF